MHKRKDALHNKDNICNAEFRNHVKQIAPKYKATFRIQVKYLYIYIIIYIY